MKTENSLWGPLMGVVERKINKYLQVKKPYAYEFIITNASSSSCGVGEEY